jgi:aryl-alcohol dehydrogenase-like predicted oxidoreductase
MTSRLVLGTANYGRLSQTEVDKLLGTALELGIDKLDTAHRYEDSEKKIGISLKLNQGFTINTKACPYGPELFTPTGIRFSVEESLRRLGIERIGTLFTHSIPPKFLTDENIETLILLKKEGKIERIGFSGDNSDLSYAIDIDVFDDFQVTMNIIDQANLVQVRRVPEYSNVYYKLSMAQAVWTCLEWKNRVKSNKRIRIILKKPPVPDSWADYRARFNRLLPELNQDDFPSIFLRFALFSGSKNQFVILGSSNPQHIREAASIELDRLNPEALSISNYEDLYTRKSSPEWSALDG